MDKIPTAEEMEMSGQYDDYQSMMRAFAKLHVKAALEAAAKQATGVIDNEWNEAVIDKDSILNAYPDKLII